VSGLVQGVEEGLAQIVVAGQEAGLHTAAAAEGCDMDMDGEGADPDLQVRLAAGAAMPIVDLRLQLDGECSNPCGLQSAAF
jgi:hypothetical protein